MQYEGKAASKNKLPTMETLDPAYQADLGKSETLTKLVLFYQLESNKNLFQLKPLIF